jgi:hypothetical protein
MLTVSDVSLSVLRVAQLTALASMVIVENASGQTFSVRDSAGVRIVENRSVNRDQRGRRFMLGEPALRIGAVGGDSTYEFHRVVGALRLSDGRIAVLDARSFQLRFFSSEGRFLVGVGRRGQGPGEFLNPSGLCRYPGDSIVVLNVGTHAGTDIFSSRGDLGRRIAFGVGTSFIDSCARDGSLLTYRTLQGFVPRSGVWRDSSTFSWVTPNGTEGPLVGRFAIQEMHETRVDGMTGRSHVPFGTSVEVEAGPDVAFVGTNESYEIRVYDLRGRLERLIRLLEAARPVSQELIRVHRESTAAFTARTNARRAEPSPSNSLPVPYPRTLPFYSALRATSNRDLWVKRYHPWDEGSRVAGQRAVTEWDVFDAEGRWSRVIEIPYSLSILDVGAEYLLGVWRDNDGVEFLHLYRLPPRAL